MLSPHLLERVITKNILSISILYKRSPLPQKVPVILTICEMKPTSLLVFQVSENSWEDTSWNCVGTDVMRSYALSRKRAVENFGMETLKIISHQQYLVSACLLIAKRT